jgi:hypothetical protein
MDSNRDGNAPRRNLSRADNRHSTIIRWSVLGSRTKPSSRSAFDYMGSSRALVPESPLVNMSRINEFLGQPRNDSLCATVEFWRGSLSRGGNLSYAQTLDSGEWLMGCTRVVWLCDRFWVEIRQGRSRPGGPSLVFAQATGSLKSLVRCKETRCRPNFSPISSPRSAINGRPNRI